MRETNYSNIGDLQDLVDSFQYQLGAFKKTAIISDNTYTATKHLQAVIDFLTAEIKEMTPVPSASDETLPLDALPAYPTPVEAA
jgi:hypothetical protein